jgi:uncharacterized protein
MRYNVAQLLKGPSGGCRQYKLEDDIRYLDAELEPLRPLVGTITLMRTSRGILVTGNLRTALQATCRRCLEPCEIEVEFDLEEEFYPAARIADVPLDDVPEEEQDEALLIDSHHILDLSEVVRQALWLFGPEKAICKPDCAGLCPTCGGNRNEGACDCLQAPIDPRWTTLQALLLDEQDSQERRD